MNMKKIICIAAAALLPLAANAQIEPKKQDAPITIASQDMYLGVISARVEILLPKTCPLYFLSLSTANEYDYPMMFYIGADINNAITSLERILSMFGEPIGSIFTLPVTDGDNTVDATICVKLNNWSYSKKNPTELRITAPGFAGDSELSKKKFVKLIDEVKAYAKTHKNAEP